MKAIKIDKSGSVLINTKKGFNVWVDIFIEDGELIANWNKYIFYRNDKLDMKIKAFQENCENFEEATNEAIDFYIKNKSKQ